MMKSINGATFRKMFLAGATLLEDKKEYVDTLNVFPVPDGDTGTNMSLTFKSVASEVTACQNNNIDTISEAVKKGALKGARGNSGVILSQIMKGMCSVFAEEKVINVKTFSKALLNGSEIAYKAVTKPKEGTILTVIRCMAEASVKIAKKTSDLEEFLLQVLNAGDEALRQTPELLPVLKKAGVVDSGGQGLMIIFNGFYKAITNDESFEINLEIATPSTESVIPNADIYSGDIADIVYAYCTEFMIIQMKKKTTLADIDKLREKLMEIGDCVLCIGDLSLVKVHVHTNNPNLALGMALELGELYNMKIENMLEQNRELKRKLKQKEELKPFGIVSICAGDGIAAIFKDLSCDYIIEGGQTMNPSADDIVTAIEKINAKDVYVLPNNKNIILAAEQAKDLTSKNVHVIPTKNIPQGIAACISFSPELSAEENEKNMTEAINTVRSGSVTYAVRKTHISGFDLDVGDIIGLDEHDIIAKDEMVAPTVEKMVKLMANDDIVNITLFYGSDVKEDDANILCEKLQKLFPDKEISMVYGGQPVYYYLLSLE